MKTFISRLLLLAAGILCLSCGTLAQSAPLSKEKVEILQNALKTATGESKPVVIEAGFDEALNLIQSLKPQATGLDPDQNLRFQYADKWFVHKDDGAGQKSSKIFYEVPKSPKRIEIVRFTTDKK